MFSLSWGGISLRLPNTVYAYSSLISAYAKSGFCDEAIGVFQSMKADVEVLKQLACGKSGSGKREQMGRKDFRCVLGVFHKMIEMEIKNNVVTFSAILNACSYCNSFEEASLLLEELRLVDNQVYGVAHGLLMGYIENSWPQALLLFDEVNRMDSSVICHMFAG
ncbi:hypothetical protein OROGR_015043 [Orobanche gracilis]